MVLPRSAAALRTFARSTRVGTAGIRASSRAGWCARRGYATEGTGHEAPKPGGDLPWIIGSLALTVPTAYYLVQSGPEASHGHEHAEEKHEEAKEEVEQPTPAKVEASAEQAAVKHEPPPEAVPEEAAAEEQKEEEKEEEKQEKSEEELRPGQHDRVPETAQKTEADPSKKPPE